MTTDWGLIRRVMNSALDACERLDRIGITEDDRSASTRVGEVDIRVWDFLQSAWVMPENFAYMVVRLRHDLNDDTPYTTEQARILKGVADFCSELIGARQLDVRVNSVDPHALDRAKSLRELAEALERWYTKEFVDGVSAALANSGNI